jgi:hypothetical protein
MQKTAYCPIRTTVGSQLPISSAKVVGRSKNLRDEEISSLYAEPTAQTRQRVYRRYWPELSVGLGKAVPAQGVSDCPLPVDAPFPAQQRALMLYGLATSTVLSSDQAEDYWVEYEIILSAEAPPLIGGLVLAGCPYLPYLSTPDGNQISNFGLPREIRVSWADAHDDGFLDAEQTFTQQMPNWHSGFHFLSFGPVRARTLRLRLSTFPVIAARSDEDPPGSNQPVSKRRAETTLVPGFLIPFLYVFEHRESVIYRPQVSAGLCAAWQSPPARADTYASAFPLPDQGYVAESAPADRVAVRAGLGPNQYGVYSAASAIHGPRAQTMDGGGIEFFCSNPLAEGNTITMVIAQARQNEACIAGLRLRTPKPAEMPKEFDGSRDFELTVYESDLPQGAEPLNRAPSTEQIAYRVRLGALRFSLSQAINGVDCRFLRASNARTFTLVFRAIGRKQTPLMLRVIELVQSAQISLAPKASKRLLVHQLNFRLIGADLAADFDRIGNGTIFEVIRQSGTGRKDILFHAESLLELVEKTGAKMYRNSRTWEIGEEVARTESRNRGWQRRESGRELRWSHQDECPNLVPSAPPKPRWSDNPTNQTFRSFGNQELRTHTEQLGYQNDPRVRTALGRINDLVAAATGNDDDQFITRPSSGADRLFAGFGTAWHGLPDTRRGTIRTIRGTYNMNLPPHALGVKYLRQLDKILTNGADPSATPEVEFNRHLAAGILSGASFSVGASVAFFAGVNASLSFGQQLPAASQIVQIGDTGTIQHQANNSNYQYAQTLNEGFDENTQVRRVLERKRNRIASPDVLWQGDYVDIVTGRIALALPLEALGGRMHGSPDVSVVARCIGLNSECMQADIWFDVSEEEVRDDY